ncbi:hypothetical protein RFI_17938 [Reticulomyxa filosa]|uniref:Arf3-interacting protein 1 N-terminal domain-containing protein n=1 Tax=Reticulomyxa filosa TaxID=46433 RepID=X6N0M4_RETFI|nr:hypothetical protein RFI_17938 [Reticulomyxa filosa]|eukprot:ETO19294.1 hypothetical protein RFI_17938 [Reticulomyxa filosa]
MSSTQNFSKENHIPTAHDSAQWSLESLSRLQNWIYGICLVDFDLVNGQIIKFVYPLDIFSAQEKLRIANLSLPNSNNSTNEMGDLYYCFRFRTRQTKYSVRDQLLNENEGKGYGTDDEEEEGVGEEEGKEKEKGEEGRGEREKEGAEENKDKKKEDKDNIEKAAKVEELTMKCYELRKHESFLFGHVFFRQKPDFEINRGYFQKSLVLISSLPYVHVFQKAYVPFFFLIFVCDITYIHICIYMYMYIYIDATSLGVITFNLAVGY